MLYVPVLCNDFAQSSPDPPLFRAPVGAPGSSPLLSGPIASYLLWGRSCGSAPPCPQPLLTDCDWQQQEPMALAAAFMANEERECWSLAQHWIKIRLG